MKEKLAVHDYENMASHVVREHALRPETAATKRKRAGLVYHTTVLVYHTHH